MERIQAYRQQSQGFEPRSPLTRRRTQAGKEALPREEKVYREIMGADGKVKPQYEHWLIDLEIDSDDLFDKKLADFRKPGESKVLPEILNTRYEFHHNKRFYKLGEIFKKREEQRAIDQAKAMQRQLEKEQQLLSSRTDEKDGQSKMNSQHGLTRPSNMNLSKRPSNMGVANNQEYSTFAGGNKSKQQFGLPGLQQDTQSRIGSQSRLRNSSRMNVPGRNTPRHSSMNVRDPIKETNHNQSRNPQAAFFMTQPPEIAANGGSQPKTGASQFRIRTGKIAPLLTPGHARVISIHASQAFSPGRSSPFDSLDVEKEKNKISRFLHTKERSGQVLAARENRIETRIKEMENKQKMFEKRQKMERKQAMAKLQEKQTEWQERRTKVQQKNQQLENQSVQDYRKAVAASKKRMQGELTQERAKQTSRQARDELLLKQQQRDMQNSTFQTEDRNSRMETIRTLETVEAKVNSHQVKAQQHKLSMSEKFSKDIERVMYQGSKHKEDQERVEMEKQCELLEKLSKRKKALDQYEKAKRLAVKAQETKNMEKQTMSETCAQKRVQDVKNISNSLRRKEAKVRRNLMDAEQSRFADLEVKKERQRLVQEDARKRMEFQKRNLNFKKLQVLDKHQKIDDLCSQLTQNKKSFIESSRIANEIRVQKMHHIGSMSPTKVTTKSKKGSPEKNQDLLKV